MTPSGPFTLRGVTMKMKRDRVEVRETLTEIVTVEVEARSRSEAERLAIQRAIDSTDYRTIIEGPDRDVYDIEEIPAGT